MSLSVLSRRAVVARLLASAVVLAALATAPTLAFGNDPPWTPLGGPALVPGQNGTHGDVVDIGGQLYTVTREEDATGLRREAVVFEFTREGAWRRVGNPLNDAGSAVRNLRLAEVGGELHALWLQAPDERGPWELRVARLVRGDHDMVSWERVGRPVPAIEAAIGALHGRPLIVYVDPAGEPRGAHLPRHGEDWEPIADAPLDSWIPSSTVEGPARVPQLATGASGGVLVSWVQFGRVRRLWVGQGSYGLTISPYPYRIDPPRASDPPRENETGRVPAGLSRTGTFTGPLGEIYTRAPDGGHWLALNELLELGEAREPSELIDVDRHYVAFVVRRRAPLNAGYVFRIAVVRLEGGSMRLLPPIQDTTEYGNQRNPTLVGDPVLGPLLVYDVQDPGAPRNPNERTAWTTRVVRLNPSGQ